MNNKIYTHLSSEEHDTLSLGFAHGHSLTQMATVLGRAPSTLNSGAIAIRGRPTHRIVIPPDSSTHDKLLSIKCR